MGKKTFVRGSLLFIILIVVALFAALNIAINRSMSVKDDSGAVERARLSGAVGDNCTANIENAVQRLKLSNGCTNAQISYELPGGGNANAQAPSDKRCHVFDKAGAGAVACGSYTTVIGGDVTPNVVNWGNLYLPPCYVEDPENYYYTSATITGIDSSIQLQVTYAQGWLSYKVGNGSYVSISGSATFTVPNGSIVTFYASSHPADSSTTGTIRNISDSNNVLDTFTITGPSSGSEC